MPNKKISQLVNKTTILSTDLFPIGDATSGQLYKKTIAELQAAIGGAVISVNGLVGTVVLDTDDVQELASPTNKYFTDARARGAVSATSPLVFNSSTGVFSIPAATTSVSGHLTSTDWNTFNGKENVLTFSSPLVRTSNTISMPAATTSVNGFLTSTDWNTFNNKQGALTLTVTGSSGASTLVGTTLNIPTYTLAGLGGITASFLSGGTGITYNSGTGVIATTITQYTDALARASLSFTAGSGGYNSTTGVITIPTNTSQLTNGASFITLASLSGGTGITYNSSTGAISYSGSVYTDSSIRGLFSGSTGISYNSTTGAISSTIIQYTDALARGAISLTTSGSSGASTYNSTTGVLNVPTYTLSGLGGQSALSGTGFVKISGTTISYDNSTYLTTASAASTYQTIITNPVTGTGTTNYLPKWTSSSALGNSALQEVSGSLGLGIVPSTNDYSTFQISDGGLFASVGTYLHIATNAYFSTTWKYRATSNGARYSQEVGAHVWYTAPSGTAGNAITFTQAMTLDASGNLMINTTSSTGERLQVLGNAMVQGEVRIKRGGTQYGTLYASSGLDLFLESNNNAAIYYNSSASLHFWRNNGTNVMALDASGRLGIGTSSPGYRLQVDGASTAGFVTAIVAKNPSTNAASAVKIGFDGGGTIWGEIGSSYNSNNPYLAFFVRANSEKMRITDTGVLAIGLTNPDGGALLDVAGGIRSIVPSGIAKLFLNNGATQLSIDNNGGNMIFNAPGGSEGMRMTSGGSVGIGTSSPSTRLEVNSTELNTIFVTNSTATGATTGSGIGFKAYNGTSVAQSAGIFLTSSTWSFGTYSANQLSVGSDGTGGLALRTANSAPITFFTGGTSAGVSTEKMRLTSGGLLGIGTTSPTNAKLKVSGSSASGAIMSEDTTSTTSFVRILGDISSQNLFNWQSGTAMRFAVSNQDFSSFSELGRITSGGNWLLGTSTDNGERLYISGNVRATGTITANSDIRLKKNLERIENALEKVGQISGYTYDTIYDDKRHGGVIAQEINEVFPEIVNKGNDGLLGVEYGNISALLIEALKEATTKIKALESKVEALQK